MNHKTKFACATVFTAAAFAAPAVYAQDTRDDSGLFISGSYGGYKSHGGEFEDENDLFAASVGYQFNEFFALEADYTDFGNFGEDDIKADLKGLGLAVRGRLPITESFGVYAKAGAFVSAFDVDAFDEDETYDDVSPFVGAGIDFRISQQLTAFAEYDRYNVDIDEDDFNGQITNDGPEFDTGRVGLRLLF